MATIVSGNSIQLGDSGDATENFVLRSNVDGTLTLARGIIGATVTDVLTISENGDLTVYGTRSDSGFRNKIIGGDFSVNPWQRGTSFPAIASGAFAADRFPVGIAGTGVFTVAKTADAPTIAEAGIFTQHCYHVDVTTADTSLAASDIYGINHRIEGYTIMPAGFGQTGAKSVTLSFWHKHTVVGTYCVSVRNNAVDRSYVAEYSQSVVVDGNTTTVTRV